MPVHVACITVGTFQVNTWLVTDDQTGESVLIDTGEADVLARLLRARTPLPKLSAIWLTHAHLDHAGGLHALQQHFDVPTYLPAAERAFFDTLPSQGAMFGMAHLDRPNGRIDHWLVDGDILNLGQTPFRFVSTPGHTPGQGCYFGAGHAFVGDTLFAGSIGRTDLPFGDATLAAQSLRRLFEEPGDTIVHSGHGPDTTLARELATNPFLGYLRKEREMPGPSGLSWTSGTS